MAKPPRRKFGLGSIMVAVAVMAISFSCLGVPGGSVAVVVFAIAYAPFAIGDPDQRLWAWVCVLAIFPTLLLLCLYLAWGIAWGTMGHEPLPTAEAPGKLGPVVAGIDVVTRMMLFGVPFSGVGCLLLATIESKRRYLINPKLRPAIEPFAAPVAWAVAFGFLRWDPFRALWWFLA